MIHCALDFLFDAVGAVDGGTRCLASGTIYHRLDVGLFHLPQRQTLLPLAVVLLSRKLLQRIPLPHPPCLDSPLDQLLGHQLFLAGYAHPRDVSGGDVLVRLPEHLHVTQRHASRGEGVVVHLGGAAGYGAHDGRLADIGRPHQHHGGTVQPHGGDVPQALLELRHPSPRLVDQIHEHLSDVLLGLLGGLVRLPRGRGGLDLGDPILGKVQQFLPPLVDVLQYVGQRQPVALLPGADGEVHDHPLEGVHVPQFPSISLHRLF
mmetsp:Transcript_19586/g.41948  ORF Transcript_19586/g.41948 Transcript_19586/m.41948 type:complete len:262 (+) Transcript_19586:353-1138(+)